MIKNQPRAPPVYQTSSISTGFRLKAIFSTIKCIKCICRMQFSISYSCFFFSIFNSIKSKVTRKGWGFARIQMTT